MFSSLATNRTASGRRPETFPILILCGALLMALLATGCGGGGDKEENANVIAKVGNNEITAEYFEGRLVLMGENELPSEDGQPLDMASDAGKRVFLEALINKELMAQKATQLGYDQDANVVAMREKMIPYEAGLAMWQEVISLPSKFISDEELAEFYEKLGTSYLCNYVICNFENDALEAREFALTGADWQDVVNQFHDGGASTTRKYEINIPFLQYATSFEDKVFATELGGISQPIPSSYGFWVLKVLEINHRDKPGLEEAKGQILDVTSKRKLNSLRQEFKEGIHLDHELVIKEDALWAVFQGLPDQGLMDPETNKPYSKDQLIDLDVRSEDLGLLLYSFKGEDGEVIQSTVAEYKSHFDKMSVFQRPKASEMLGSLRQKIIGEIGRGLVNMEAKKRGFWEHPAVLAKVNLKVEEAMVTRLYQEVITFDDRVTSEQMKEFWAEHKDEYHEPESRIGYAVVCPSREMADAAHKAAMDGKPWPGIVMKFGSELPQNSKDGGTGKIYHDSESPLKDSIYSLQEDDVSQPFPLDGGLFAVVQLDSISAAHDFEMHEVSENLGGRIKQQRQEDAFQALLAQWSDEFGVEIFSDKLAGLKSWQELTTNAILENQVQ